MITRSDLLARVLQEFQNRLNDDETAVLNENVVREIFHPISEKLTLSDTVEASYYTPSQQVWGSDVVEPNWRWGYGGRWQT